MANPCILATFALFAILLRAQGGTANSERDLRQDLFRSYDSQARPVIRASTQVPVSMSMTPLSIRSWDEKEQILVMDTWIMMNWTDEYLKWDPKEYDNITQIHLSPSEIWKPDLALYSSSSDTVLFPVVQTQAIASNSGKVLWVPPFTVRSRCPVPFRNHVITRSFVECIIQIGSWTYSGPLMDIQLATENVDLSNFQDFNSDWKLVKVVANREGKHYPCCPEEYPLVNFNVTMKRRNYFLNLGN